MSSNRVRGCPASDRHENERSPGLRGMGAVAGEQSSALDQGVYRRRISAIQPPSSRGSRPESTPIGIVGSTAPGVRWGQSERLGEI
jgi:hypothetical protein